MWLSTDRPVFGVAVCLLVLHLPLPVATILFTVISSHAAAAELLTFILHQLVPRDAL